MSSPPVKPAAPAAPSTFTPPPKPTVRARRARPAGGSSQSGPVPVGMGPSLTSGSAPRFTKGASAPKPVAPAPAAAPQPQPQRGGASAPEQGVALTSAEIESMMQNAGSGSWVLRRLPHHDPATHSCTA